jgi:hypothetical protein
MRSLIFLIYILILLQNIQAQTPQSRESIPQREDREDEKLRLIYQVFVYSTDLQNAYKTAKLALKRRPNSLYWHYKMSEVASWIGKGRDAVKSLDFIYRHTGDKKVKKRILKSALELYQYEIAAPLIKEKTMKNPTKKNIKDMVFVYNQIGKPEISAKVLESISKRAGGREDLLREALKVYTLLGDRESAKRVIEQLNRFPSLKVETAREMANFYIPQRELKKAYRVLLKAWKNRGKNRDYLVQISDIGWYIKDFKYSAIASRELIKLKKGRSVDYERVIAYYRERDLKIVELASFESFKKYKKGYFLELYLTTLYSQKKYKKLYKSMKKIERDRKLFKKFQKDINYYLMRAEVTKSLKLYEEAEKSYKKLISLKSDSSEYKMALFWFYIDTKRTKILKRKIFQIEDSQNVDRSFYLPLAMAHYFLNNVDRAIYYIKLVRERKKSIDTDLTYAYLMQLRGDEEAFKKTMLNIYEYLDKKLSKNSSLIYNRKFLTKYLESGIYFMDSDRFERLLESSKNILGKEKYLNLKTAWSQKNGSSRLTKYISQKFLTPKPWIDLGIALSENDYAKVQKLIFRYYLLAPLDRAVGAKKSGNIFLAKSILFEAEEKNRENSSIYRQQRDLDSEYASRASLNSGFDTSKDSAIEYIRGDVSHYISKGYYVEGAFKIQKNIDKSSRFPNNVPSSDTAVEIGVRKIFDRGEIEVKSGIHHEAKSHGYFEVASSYEATDRVTLHSSYQRGVEANENGYLTYGGKKNEINLRGDFRVVPSARVSLFGAYDEFYSQDNQYLGTGFLFRGDVTKSWHSAFFDFQTDNFVEYGDFSDSSGDKGTIEEMKGSGSRVLPNEYLKVGSKFSYGVSSRDSYNRVWRPYFEFTPSYNLLSNSADFLLNAGYGGSLFGQDKLRFDFNYGQSLSNIDESNFGLNMSYELLY